MSFYSNSDVESRPVFLDLSVVMRQVYVWMTVGLLVTATVSFGMASSGVMYAFMSNPVLMLLTIVGYFILAFALQPVIMRAPLAVSTLLYLVVTALLGVMISSIFLTYRIETIGYAFIATAATFGVISVFAYTTKIDLSQFRGILMAALIGLIVASIVNIFFANDMLYWLINYAGVLIFIGLTAYDTQWIKKFAGQVATASDPDWASRVALVGAFHKSDRSHVVL